MSKTLAELSNHEDGKRRKTHATGALRIAAECVAYLFDTVENKGVGLEFEDKVLRRMWRRGVGIKVLFQKMDTDMNQWSDFQGVLKINGARGPLKVN